MADEKEIAALDALIRQAFANISPPSDRYCHCDCFECEEINTWLTNRDTTDEEDASLLDFLAYGPITLLDSTAVFSFLPTMLRHSLRRDDCDWLGNVLEFLHRLKGEQGVRVDSSQHHCVWQYLSFLAKHRRGHLDEATFGQVCDRWNLPLPMRSG